MSDPAGLLVVVSFDDEAEHLGVRAHFVRDLRDMAAVRSASVEWVEWAGADALRALLDGQAMSQAFWDDCPAVWSDPGRVSGAVCFRGTRLPVDHLFANLRHGATVAEFVEWYQADPEQVDAVLALVMRSIEAARGRRAGRSWVAGIRVLILMLAGGRFFQDL